MYRNTYASTHVDNMQNYSYYDDREQGYGSQQGYGGQQGYGNLYQQPALKQPPKRKRGCCCGLSKKSCCIVTFFILAVLAVILFFCIPRVPSISMQTITFGSVESNSTTLQLPLRIPFSVASENWYDYHIDSLTFDAWGQGTAKLTNQTLLVGGLGSFVIKRMATTSQTIIAPLVVNVSNLKSNAALLTIFSKCVTSTSAANVDYKVSIRLAGLIWPIPISGSTKFPCPNIAGLVNTILNQ